MSRRLPPFLVTVGGALIALSLVVPSNVSASFPGQNGRILFDSPRSGATRIQSVDPDVVNPPVVLASNGSGEDLAASARPTVHRWCSPATASAPATDRTSSF